MAGSSIASFMSWGRPGRDVSGRLNRILICPGGVSRGLGGGKRPSDANIYSLAMNFKKYLLTV